MESNIDPKFFGTDCKNVRVFWMRMPNIRCFYLLRDTLVSWWSGSQGILGILGFPFHIGLVQPARTTWGGVGQICTTWGMGPLDPNCQGLNRCEAMNFLDLVFWIAKYIIHWAKMQLLCGFVWVPLWLPVSLFSEKTWSLNSDYWFRLIDVNPGFINSGTILAGGTKINSNSS